MSVAVPVSCVWGGPLPNAAEVTAVTSFDRGTKRKYDELTESGVNDNDRIITIGEIEQIDRRKNLTYALADGYGPGQLAGVPNLNAANWNQTQHAAAGAVAVLNALLPGPPVAIPPFAAVPNAPNVPANTLAVELTNAVNAAVNPRFNAIDVTLDRILTRLDLLSAKTNNIRIHSENARIRASRTPDAVITLPVKEVARLAPAPIINGIINAAVAAAPLGALNINPIVFFAGGVAAAGAAAGAAAYNSILPNFQNAAAAPPGAAPPVASLDTSPIGNACWVAPGGAMFLGALTFADINALTDAQIAALRIFYNQDFGIVNADPLPTKQQKLLNAWCGQ